MNWTTRFLNGGLCAGEMSDGAFSLFTRKHKREKPDRHKIYRAFRASRFLADSNCCKRFCRPAPNHSAKEPPVFRTFICNTLLNH